MVTQLVNNNKHLASILTNIFDVAQVNIATTLVKYRSKDVIGVPAVIEQITCNNELIEGDTFLSQNVDEIIDETITILVDVTVIFLVFELQTDVNHAVFDVRTHVCTLCEVILTGYELGSDNLAATNSLICGNQTNVDTTEVN